MSSIIPSFSSPLSSNTASSYPPYATATTVVVTSSNQNETSFACTSGINCSNFGLGIGTISLNTIFYFVGFLVLGIALFYTLFMVRRRHRRKNNRPRDPEMVEHRNNSTYRPESGDEVSPPQYRAYMLDQPYHDPEMAYPDSVHYGAEQGMIQHLAVLEQQERCQQQTAGATEVLLDQDNQDVADNVERPMLTTTTTTTTLTTTTTTTITQPAPAHAQTFFTGRHLSILRLGLSNYHHNHSRSSSSNSSSSQSTSSSSSSGSRSSPRPARQMWTNPATYSESYMVIGHEISTNSNNTNHYTTSATTSCSSSSNMPALYRLRSMGPPPYIPPSDDEEAPALPPSYNVAVEVPVHTTPIVSSEIAAH